ncbi:MAG TPA: hypothetical protein VMF30_15925 [Pirellulales bacterium]|nr:hypothetical protein [Pirellulales bacterium]
MSRSAVGFLTGVGYCLAANVLMFVAFLRIDSPTLCVVIWWMVNFPSVPFLTVLGRLIPAPVEGASDHAWEYQMWAAGALCASCIWGLFGMLVARLMQRRSDPSIAARAE